MEKHRKILNNNDQINKQSERILVVDDEPIVRKSISKYLSKMGYDVDTADDGSNAIKKLDVNQYDLVLTDLQMPNIDGRELLKYMAGTYPDIPKIVFTAYGEDKDIILSLQTGARDFLYKPIVDFAILDHSIKRALEIKRLNDEKDRYVDQVKQINEIISMLNKGMDTDDIFKSLNTTLKEVISFNRLDLIIIDELRDEIISRLEDTDGKILLSNEGSNLFETFVQVFKDVRKTLIIDDIRNYLKDNPHRKETSLLLEKGLRSSLILPLIINDVTRGFLVFSSVDPGFFKKEHINFLESIVGQISFSIQRGELLTEQEKHTVELEHLVQERSDQIIKIQKTTIFALSQLAETRDPGTGQHLEKIRDYSVLLARLLKYCADKYDITNQFLRDIYDSSILHDIGKVGISDTILLKSSTLTPEEFEIMKTHTTIGYKALHLASRDLGDDSFLKMSMDIVLYHHERWDGTGYPEGLAGEEIPLAARIVRLVDVYDALTSERPYKTAYSHEMAIQTIDNERSHFDPDLLNLFNEYASEFNNIRNHYSNKK